METLHIVQNGLVLLGGCLLVLRFADLLGVGLSILFLYFIAHAGFFALLHTGIRPEELALGIQFQSLWTFLVLLLVMWVLLTPMKWLWEMWLEVLPVFIGIWALILLFSKYSFFTGQSFDSALIALFVPAMLASYNSKHVFVAGVLAVLAVFWIGGSVGLLVLAAQLFGYVVTSKVVRYRVGAVLFTLLAIILGSNYGGEFLHAHGRVAIWKTWGSWWKSNINPWWGSGLGSFEWIGPFLPIEAGGKTYRYIWGHSDWFQLLLESGIVGVSLAFLGFGYFLWVLRHERVGFSLVTGFGACMLFYSPLHTWFGQIVGLFILKLVSSEYHRKTRIELFDRLREAVSAEEAS